MTQASATLPEADPASARSSAELRFVRADHIAAGYSPWRHMALTLVLAILLATLGLALAARARTTDWLLLPAFLVIANLIEWMVHRHPMHRPLRPRIMYRNHAQLHHLAFTDGQMVIGPTRDLGLIMMPWYTMLGLFGLTSPIMIVAGLLRGPGLAGVFLLGAVGYFLCYELLHALYHLPDATLDRAGIGRLRAFRRLQAHHRHHHILGRMAAVNFNVTFPLWDRLLGTLER
jgi:sterol desaturase/sphingolipid hydroxylase (fatty acid hydroxylase superfamily)